MSNKFPFLDTPPLDALLKITGSLILSYCVRDPRYLEDLSSSILDTANAKRLHDLIATFPPPHAELENVRVAFYQILDDGLKAVKIQPITVEDFLLNYLLQNSSNPDFQKDFMHFIEIMIGSCAELIKEPI